MKRDLEPTSPWSTIVWGWPTFILLVYLYNFYFGILNPLEIILPQKTSHAFSPIHIQKKTRGEGGKGWTQEEGLNNDQTSNSQKNSFFFDPDKKVFSYPDLETKHQSLYFPKKNHESAKKRKTLKKNNKFLSFAGTHKFCSSPLDSCDPPRKTSVNFCWAKLILIWGSPQSCKGF